MSSLQDFIDGLKASSTRVEFPSGPNPGRPAPPEDLPSAFFASLEALGVTVHRVANEEELQALIVRLADGGAVAGSGTELTPAEVSREDLFDCALGVSEVQVAVAETGTLALASDEERHRLVSLVPPTHLAIVRSDRLVWDLDEAYAKLAEGGLAPTVSFITGPSRTADIELTLVVGVHGPRELHVVWMESVSSAP